MKHLCKECIHYGLCEYSTIIDEKIECKNFFPKIVCCKDCKFCEETEYYHPTDDNAIKTVCRLYKRTMQGDDFCSYGKRREEG